MPNKYRINKRIKELNKYWNLKPTPGEVEGVQQRFEDSLKTQIERLRKKGSLKDNETLRVKLSGDGTNIGKRLKVVNFTYTILNEKDIAMGEKGNYVLAIIKTTEEYDNLRDSLIDLRNEMENLKEIQVNGCTYKIDYFLCGDWKFLALVCGVGKANQDYACIWCKCPRAQRWHTSKQWSITDSKFGARSLNEIECFASAKKYNCRKKPLFKFISLDHVVIDTLHLFLRISDNLIDLFVRELRRQDSIDKKNFFLRWISKGQVQTYARI